MLTSDIRLALSKITDINPDIQVTIGKLIIAPDVKTQSKLIEKYIKESDETQHNKIYLYYYCQ